MVNLTIDDKQVTVPKNATIFDAAKAAGIRIPILCHDKKLHPFGGCRMCLVEVEQMKGRQIPACTTPATEGMIVRTMTDEIIKARRMVLELLLLKHPIDCPVCDAAGDCDLQNLTYEYQVNVNRFQDEKFNHAIDYENPLIERDMNRCIHCGKCARICDEIVSLRIPHQPRYRGRSARVRRGRIRVLWSCSRSAWCASSRPFKSGPLGA
jgi:NADH dehydrogenase/NADH:ubiquinone oxidoreductase subunit G